MTYFGGSEDLNERFDRWQQQWDRFDHWENDIDYTTQKWREWEAEGLGLAAEFREVLSPEYALWYIPLTGGVVEVTLGE